MGFLMTQNTSEIPIRSYGGRTPIRQTINGLAQTASLADGSTAVWNPPAARPAAYPRRAIARPPTIRITPLSGIPGGGTQQKDFRLMPMPTYTAPAQAATMRPAPLREGLGAVTSSEYVAIGADIARRLVDDLVAGGNTAAAGAVPAAVVKATEEVQQQQSSKAPWFIAGVLGLGVLILAFGKGGRRAKK